MNQSGSIARFVGKKISKVSKKYYQESVLWFNLACYLLNGVNQGLQHRCMTLPCGNI